MSVIKNKKPWSIALIWGYLLGVTATFFILIAVKVLLKQFGGVEKVLRIEEWAILLVLFIPVVFVVKRNRLLLKAMLFGFLIYACIGFIIILVGLAGSWGGRVTFKILPYVVAIGFGGVLCSLMTFLFEKLLSRSKALS